MCLLGVLAERPRPFATWLEPHLSISRRGFDAWGASMYTPDRSWTSERFAGSEAGQGVLTSTAAEMSAMIAQGTMRSVRDTALSRTPPFRRGRWVFAHAGPLEDVAILRSRTSSDRQRQCGAADSELLFAFLLTRLDENDVTERRANELVDAAIISAANHLATSSLGSASFVLSDGETLYAYRRGRPVHLLEERPPGIGASAIVGVASGATTTGPWISLEEGTLVRCRCSPTLDVCFLTGDDPRRPPISEIELPFTD